MIGIDGDRIFLVDLRNELNRYASVVDAARDGLHRLAVLYFRSVMSNASQRVDTFDEVPCLICIV
ncbi:hypothetical protein [Mesorhizobium sp. M0522]|uniref:hypothetical protein n=1 Tax=Mesorhizobium sp. M0522 TaxID=2956958 RepID=UPI003337E1AB